MFTADVYILSLWLIRKAKTVFDAFVEIGNVSNRKPNELWADQGKEFHNKFIKNWLNDNGIFMYSTITYWRVYKNLERMTNDSYSYFDYLDELVDEYKNAYHCSIGKKPVDAGSSALLKKSNEITKLANLISDRIRITKSSNTFWNIFKINIYYWFCFKSKPLGVFDEGRKWRNNIRKLLRKN